MVSDSALFDAAIAADFLTEHGFPAAEILYEAAFVTLLPFCDRDPFRMNTGQPWVYGGYLYATDARIMVRLRTSRPNTEQRVQNAVSVFAGLVEKDVTLRWEPWPTKPIFVHTDEDKQSGIPCPICDGDGSYFTAGDDKACVYCDRSGYVERFDNVSLGNPFDASSPLVAGRYWSLISRLPDVWYRQPKDEESPIHFRFRGGEGLLMQIRKQ